jgi:ferredoxin
MGFGSCVDACQFDAIHVVDGVAVVDKETCVACGKCVSACPKNLIELIPYGAPKAVACNSKDKGKDVRVACKTGCIGCSICVKQCEAGAITVEDNLAKIDYSKCNGCGKCAEKCPQKIIVAR